MKNLIISIAALLSVIIANMAMWNVLNRPLNFESFIGIINGVTYEPSQGGDPQDHTHASEESINADLAVLENNVWAIRTYTTTEGLENLPELAAKHKLYVTAGAWIGKDLERNEREIGNLLPMGVKYPNVIATLVGNEALLREDVTVDQMIGYLRRVRGKSGRAVSTSEPWHIWLKYPQLAEEVDFIAIHILPYWEGIPMEEAVPYVVARYKEMKQRFPDKKIVITEVGWPSNGKPIHSAIASLGNEANFLREFLNTARSENIDYYIIEAFDQPWKVILEGTGGAYWGIFDSNRNWKFSLEGKVAPLPGWQLGALVAAIMAVAGVALFYNKWIGLSFLGKLVFNINANVGASLVAWTTLLGILRYHSFFVAIFWVLLVLMQLIAFIILLIESIELAEVMWGEDKKRRFGPLKVASDYPFPKVSVHVPIHNEPADMVCKTLDSLNWIDYSNFEVLVIDNNTKDPAVWQPVKEHCEKLGSKFRFFHLENWPGFKAGALNYALDHTDPNAEIVAVIDSDYIIRQNWLKSLVPYFKNPEVGLVQAPQDYRDSNESLFKKCCYWEYAGFFYIGMVQRNQYNSIIQHGTMTMVRKTALFEVGKWAEWCITEDCEMGLQLYSEGYDSVYVNHSFGRGLMPDTFTSYKTQRFRWVYGAMQIIKHNWSILINRTPKLTADQRYYYWAGWMPWFSDAFSLLFTLGSLLLTGVALYQPKETELPVIAFLLPSILLFSFKLLRLVTLYLVVVPCRIWHIFGASLAGLALTFTVAKATFLGLFSSGRPFIRTPKCTEERSMFSLFHMVKEELFMLILLWSGAFLLYQYWIFDNVQGRIWEALLLIQSIPYVCSIILAYMQTASVRDKS